MLSRLPTRCKHCKAKFTPEERGLRIHPACIDAWSEAFKAKQEAKRKRDRVKAAKVERAQTRERREAIKTIADLIAEAQKEFNAWIRARDADKPCICCGRKATEVDGLGAHGWDAGHYRSTGSASHLRFNENNCHRQLVLCNRYGAGRAVDYRIGLIARIGLAAVEALEADNTVKKWGRDELRAIRSEYRAKCKALKEKTE